MEIYATNAQPDEQLMSVKLLAKDLVLLLAFHLAERIASLLCQVLDHSTKVLYDPENEVLFLPQFWLLPIYRELLNTASRIRPSRDSELRWAASGLVKVLCKPSDSAAGGKGSNKSKPPKQGGALARFNEWLGSMSLMNTLYVWLPFLQLSLFRCPSLLPPPQGSFFISSSQILFGVPLTHTLLRSLPTTPTCTALRETPSLTDTVKTPLPPNRPYDNASTCKETNTTAADTASSTGLLLCTLTHVCMPPPASRSYKSRPLSPALRPAIWTRKAPNSSFSPHNDTISDLEDALGASDTDLPPTLYHFYLVALYRLHYLVSRLRIPQTQSQQPTCPSQIRQHHQPRHLRTHQGQRPAYQELEVLATLPAILSLVSSFPRFFTSYCTLSDTVKAIGIEGTR